MRKVFSSFVFIVAFATYAVFHTHTTIAQVERNRTVSASSGSIIITNVTTTATTTSTNERHVTLTPTSKKPTVAKTKMPIHVMHAQRGPYVDGVYTGPLADAYYERIKVQVVIKNGMLTKVSFLPFQIYNGTSQAITGYAMPRLRFEALKVQSANVNNISGATEISNAFHSSLAGALLKAS